MAENPPYVTAYGNISKALKKIHTAQTPPRFTQDFLASKLGLKGGSAKPLIPFLKRTGFIGSDGVPTELYKQFRGTPEQQGAAAAKALKIGYASLFEVNEYIHCASDDDLKSCVIQVTGAEAGSQAVRVIVNSFKALAEFAKYNSEDESDGEEEDWEEEESDGSETGSDSTERVVLKKGLGLSYTINLNLPATSDIKVFDAIFKSLRENLL